MLMEPKYTQGDDGSIMNRVVDGGCVLKAVIDNVVCAYISPFATKGGPVTRIGAKVVELVDWYLWCCFERSDLG